jgi:hypothetical protein
MNFWLVQFEKPDATMTCPLRVPGISSLASQNRNIENRNPPAMAN